MVTWLSGVMRTHALGEAAGAEYETESRARKTKLRVGGRETRIARGEEVRSSAPGAALRQRNGAHRRSPDGIEQLLDTNEALEQLRIAGFVQVRQVEARAEIASSTGECNGMDGGVGERGLQLAGQIIDQGGGQRVAFGGPVEPDDGDLCGDRFAHTASCVVPRTDSVCSPSWGSESRSGTGTPSRRTGQATVRVTFPPGKVIDCTSSRCRDCGSSSASA